MPSTTNPSSKRVAFLIAMPRAPARAKSPRSRGRGEHVDRGGSTRITPPSGDGAACCKPTAFDLAQQRQPVFGFRGERLQKVFDPGAAVPWNITGERAGAGQQRAGGRHDAAADPIVRQGGTQRCPLAAFIEPAMHAERGAEECRSGIADGVEMRRSLGDRGPPCLIRFDEPAIKPERMMGSSEDNATINH